MFKKIAAFASVASVLLVATACSTQTSEKEEPTDEVTSDFSKNTVRVAGSLDYGQTSSSTSYKSSDKWVAYKFAGNEGDQLDIWVKSKNGDTVAWVLDNGWHSIAKNDDASSSTLNSHITVTLPASTSSTYYVAVRDYSYDPMSFTVALQGTPATPDWVSGCNTDADCGEVEAACCHNGNFIPVLGSKAASYTKQLNCQANQMCPMFIKAWDGASPVCNTTSHKCERVQKFCGGFAGFQCSNPNTECVDNPNDDCDPANGGADCGGLCKQKASTPTPSDCRTDGCGTGQDCSFCWGHFACIPHGAMC